jgi:hypothetical protein
VNEDQANFSFPLRGVLGKEPRKQDAPLLLCLILTTYIINEHFISKAEYHDYVEDLKAQTG